MSGPATGITTRKGTRSLTVANEVYVVRLINSDTGVSSVRKITLVG
jgi:hypothetical protein